MKRVLIIVAAIMLLACSTAYASSQNTLPMSSFSVESPGGGSSGLVAITGQHNGAGIVNIQASAFEQEYILTDAQISQLSGFLPNGIKLTYGGGFGGLSERVYVQFCKGVLQGVEETTTLILTAEGDAWLVSTSNVMYEAD